MEKEYILDKLNRAYEMEEDMAGILLDLCDPRSISGAVRQEHIELLSGMLASIKKDTLRHKALLGQLRDALNKNGYTHI